MLSIDISKNLILSTDQTGLQIRKRHMISRTPLPTVCTFRTPCLRLFKLNHTKVTSKTNFELF